MTKGLFFVLTTLIGFTAGIFVGKWMQRTQAVAPPPMGLMGEIRDVPLTPSPQKPQQSPGAAKEKDPQESEKLARIKSEIDAFRKKIDPLRTEFRHSLQGLLTTEQLERLKAMSEHPTTPKDGAEKNAKSGKSKDRYAESVDAYIPIVFVPWTLERLADELDLDDKQKAEVLPLLAIRRQRFLTLVDESPPPSFNLGKAAPKPAEITAPKPDAGKSR